MRTQAALRLFLESTERANLLEADLGIRRLEREAAHGGLEARHRHEAALIRSGQTLEAAKRHLHHHGIAYLKAYAANKASDASFDDSEEAWAQSEKTEAALKDAHKDYRAAVHEFRDKHNLSQPDAAYYRMQGDTSRLKQSAHVGEDSFAGKALPSHETAGMSREDHAHAVASAVHYDHEAPQRMVSAERSHHVEEAVAHHHPKHKQEWEVIEHNRDKTPNSVAFRGLGEEKKRPEEKTRRIAQFRQGLPIYPDK